MLDLAELERLARKAKLGTMSVRGASVLIESEPHFVVEAYTGSSANAALIVAAVNTLPRLLAIAAAARGVVDYNDAGNFGDDWQRDWAGKFAALREALDTEGKT